MRTFKRLKWYDYVILFIIASIILLVSIINSSNYLLPLLLIIWLFGLVYSFSNYKECSALLYFLISFYIFLIGREVAFHYFNLPKYYVYLMQYDRETYCCMLISLLFILFGYSIKVKNRNGLFLSYFSKDLNSRAYSNAFEIVFYICYLCTLIQLSGNVANVFRYGYVESYSAENIDQNGSGIIQYISAFRMTAYCFFLASFAGKKKTWTAIIFMEVYSVLSLLGGSRFSFIAINLLNLIYLSLRDQKDGKWLPKRLKLKIVIVMPFVFVFLVALDSIRLGKSFAFSNLYNTIINFFDQLGGSVNCIKRVFYYKKDLSDLSFVSFSNFRSIVFENVFMRKLFKVTSYTGNSYEHAMFGHSLMHRLSYYEYGKEYLTGRGVGSSYIAELFHDFGYIGIALGSFLYGYILKKIDNINFRNRIQSGVLLTICYDLLHAPRGSFDGALNSLISLYSLLAFLVTWVLYKLIKTSANH